MPMRLHIVVALVSLLSFRAAWAQSQASLVESEPVRIVVDKVATVHIKVHPLVTTKLIFESPIDDLHRADWDYFNFERQAGELTLQPQTMLRDGRGVWGKFSVETRASHVTVVVQATEDPMQATGGLRIVHRELAELEDSKAKGSNHARQLKNALTRLTALEGMSKHTETHMRDLADSLVSVTTERDEAIKERDRYKAQAIESANRVQEAERQLAQARKEWAEKRKTDGLRNYLDEGRPELKPVAHGVSCGNTQVCVDLVRARPGDDGLKIHWSITNGEALPLHITEIRQSRPVQRAIDAVVVDVASDKQDVVFTVDPGQTVEGAVLVPDITQKDLRSFALAFITDSGRQLAATGIDFYPMSKREMEDRDRDEEAQGRVTIQVVGLAGAVWLANPLNKEELDAATLWNFGVRTGYGFNRYFAFEGELVLGWSEQARFNEGALTRSAKLGRASAGVVLSLGHTIVPTFRAGVGGQAVSHDAQMESGMEIDTNFELDAVWYFSGGVNYRISKGFKIGAELGLISEASQLAGEGTRGTFHAGLHVAGSWQP